MNTEEIKANATIQQNACSVDAAPLRYSTTGEGPAPVITAPAMGASEPLERPQSKLGILSLILAFAAVPQLILFFIFAIFTDEDEFTALDAIAIFFLFTFLFTLIVTVTTAIIALCKKRFSKTCPIIALAVSGGVFLVSVLLILVGVLSD